MNSLPLLRLQLPLALLVALLQRTPVVRVAQSAASVIAARPLGAVLRSALAATASLGALHSLAGATVLLPSQASPVNASAGAAITPIGFTVTNTINIGSWRLTGDLPPGLELAATQGGTPLTGSGILDATGGGLDDGYGGQIGGNSTTTPLLRGTPTAAGNYTFSLQAFELGGARGLASATFNYTINVTGAASPTPPSVTTQPQSQAAVAGGAVTLSTAATGSPAFRWQRNGSDLTGGTGATLTISDTQPTSAGIYAAVLTSAGGSTTTQPAIVGVTSTSKVIGSGSEVGSNIVFSNGNTFDQILLEGAAATVTADPGQIVRTSFIDLTHDIVQVEFSGAGSLSIVLDNPSGPAAPVNYNQAVTYMKGHVGIVVTGANETTNLSVFSVGRANAVNQALFRSDVTYDGYADVAFVAITSSNGKFGGLRTANATYLATKGYTGVYAPGVEFTGPVFVGNINASDSATPVLQIGSGTNVRITGGDLQQANGRAVQVSGLTQLLFTDGSSSHGTLTLAQANKGRLEQNGADVTAQVVVKPSS